MRYWSSVFHEILLIHSFGVLVAAANITKIYKGKNHCRLLSVQSYGAALLSLFLTNNSHQWVKRRTDLGSAFHVSMISTYQTRCWHADQSFFCKPDPRLPLCRMLLKTIPGSLMLEWVWSAMCSQPLTVDSPTPPCAEHWMVCSVCACILEEDRKVRWWSRPPAALLAFIFSVCWGCSRRKATLDSRKLNHLVLSSMSVMIHFL